MKDQRELLVALLQSGLGAIEGRIVFWFGDAGRGEKTEDTTDESPFVEDTPLDRFMDNHPDVWPSTATGVSHPPAGLVVPVREPKKWLSKEDVWAIRRHIKAGRANSDIAKRMGIKDSAVWRTKHGKSYRNIGEEPHASTRRPTTVHVGHGVLE